ncbi:MAG TPA: hypothetical protein VIN93_08260 [Bryobacteraceae bacterium]
MAKSADPSGARPTVPVIGVDASELRWVRALISLLRHPDPVVAELTRHALEYLSDSAASKKAPGTQDTPLDHTG